jgi:hypothetical protein
MMDADNSKTTLEQRLTAVEREVAELRSQLTLGAPPADWLEKITGSVTDEGAFREVLELGRAIRSADRPHENGDDGS